MFYYFPLNVFLFVALHCVKKLRFDLIKTKDGPVGNRHVDDHITCNFHATDSCSIYVIEYIGIVTMEGLSRPQFYNLTDTIY